MKGLLQNYFMWKLVDMVFKKASTHFMGQPTKVIAANDTVLYIKDDMAKKMIPARAVKKNEVVGNLSNTGAIILNGRKIKVVRVHSPAYKQSYIAVHNDVEFKKNRLNVIR